jgi:hypothetical protein
MTTENTRESEQNTNGNFTTACPEIRISVDFKYGFGNDVPLIGKDSAAQFHWYTTAAQHILNSNKYNDHFQTENTKMKGGEKQRRDIASRMTEKKKQSGIAPR